MLYVDLPSLDRDQFQVIQGLLMDPMNTWKSRSDLLGVLMVTLGVFGKDFLQKYDLFCL